MPFDKQLLARSDALYEELVPPVGPAHLLGGELLRATVWLCRCWLERQERFDQGAGQGTCKAAYEFLAGYSPLRRRFRFLMAQPHLLDRQAMEDRLSRDSIGTPF